MSWRDTLKSRSEGSAAMMGRFRSARFVVPNSDATIGRRNEVHEYPLRDLPYVEDLGRKARQFQVEVFVDGRVADGGDYLTARDALISALEESGPGTLVHPWYGTLTVSVTEANVHESTREGGRATFRLSFIEAGELRFPTSGRDTQVAVATAGDDFSEVFDVTGLPGWSEAEVVADLYTTLTGLENQVDGVSADIAGQIRHPAGMATRLIGSVQRLGGTVSEPQRALQLYSALFGTGDDAPSVPATTATRRRQAVGSAALHRLVQQVAVIEAARASSRADYATRDEALDTAARLQDALDDQMEATDPVTGRPVGDAVYDALLSLRAAVTTDLRGRGARLPELTTYTPAATLPALVVAHQMYGDAERAEEIISRNGIRHPGFVAGGEELEVLNG